jgi:alkanesulfonate monooxygenase SsuD/methylene tetrahydromethanopterin reductase-like flavin-dependent oxidoreductase (luciferase family)
VKFGIFFELSTPRPWTPESQAQVYKNSIEQAALAESLGFDQLWAAEHHFLEEYSHSSAPEIFLTACALATTTIRIGHGIATCVPEINSPVRLAERVAWLDIISNGRVEFGTGRSSTWAELGGFGVDPESTKSMWAEYVEAIPKMWMQERFSWHGKHFSMPERSVLPMPFQRPHPPMWVAVTSPGTELDAGRRGLGCLGLVTGGLSAQQKRIESYRAAIQNCEPVGGFVNACVNTTNFLFCHEDAGTAIRIGSLLADSFSSAAAQIMMVKDYVPTTTYKAPGLLASLRTELDSRGAKKAPDGMTYGTPGQIAATIAQWESIGVDRIMFLVNAMETIPQQQVLESMRLFAREVMPRFIGKSAAASASTPLQPDALART